MDSVCDAIDPCPFDPRNVEPCIIVEPCPTSDVDGDGICDDDDVCPEVSDPDQADANQDGTGDACGLLADYNCAPPAVLLDVGSTVLPDALYILAVDAVPGSDTVYLLISVLSPTYPGHVVAVDAPTGSVLWSQLLRGEPRFLARSDDDSLLYVAKDQVATVQVVDLEARRACGSIILPTDAFRGSPLFGGEMAVAPGARETVVVTLLHGNLSPRDADVAVFDGGSVRPQQVGEFSAFTQVVLDSAEHGWGFQDNSTRRTFHELDITSAGITATERASRSFGGFGSPMQLSQGLLYFDNGDVVDPVLAERIGGPLARAATVSGGRMYASTDNVTIGVYNPTTAVLIRTVAAPSIEFASNMGAWGSTGVLGWSSGGIVFVDSL
jgi:outer membrane protein assembly factor BamB